MNAQSIKIHDNVSLGASAAGAWVYYNSYHNPIEKATVHIHWTGSDQNDGTFYVYGKTGDEANDYIELGNTTINAAAGSYSYTTTHQYLGFKVAYTKGTATAGTFDANLIMKKS